MKSFLHGAFTPLLICIGAAGCASGAFVHQNACQEHHLWRGSNKWYHQLAYQRKIPTVIQTVRHRGLLVRGGQEAQAGVIHMARSSAKAVSKSGNAIGTLRGIVTTALKAIGTLIALIRENVTTLTSQQKMLMCGVFLLGFISGRVKPIWKRFTDVMEIPGSYFGPSATPLVGTAITVSDGDTIRFLHVPTPFHPKGIRKEKKEKASSVGLPIRICTIDTPETAKFGKSGQPFGNEAKAHLQQFLDGKKVFVRLLQKDQYGRAVGQVYVNGLTGRRFVDEEMLKTGLAEVYTGGGAVYGPKGLDAYTEMQAKAQASKLGIWSQGKRESAAEYKKRTK